MKVSVCITTYNLEKYISKCLDSVLRQKTKFDYEILVGDDNSIDNTLNILRVYERKYPEKIKVIHHTGNIGVNANDYSLITRASGEYIAWCDGDDYWIDDYKLQKQVDFLDINPQFSCVHTNWTNFEEKNGNASDTNITPHDWESKLSGKTYIENLLSGKTTGCRFSSIMYRRDIVLQYVSKDSGIYLEVPHYQNDLAVFCILALRGAFGFLKDVTTVYVIRKNSLSHSDKYQSIVKYQMGLLHLQSYLINRHNLGKDCCQTVMRGPLSIILPYSYISENYSLVAEADYICKKTNYKYRFGQYLMVKSFRLPFLHNIIKKWLMHRLPTIKS